MGTLSDAVGGAIDARARDLAAEGAAPNPGAERRVAARGRRRAGVGLGAAAGLAAVALWLPAADATTDFAPSPEPTPGQEVTVTVPLDTAEWATGLFGEPLTCGEAVPAPNLSERGFTLDVTTHESTFTRIESTLSYRGDPYDDALVDEPTAYIIHDGAVVGSVWSYGQGRYPVVDIREEWQIDGPTFTPGAWLTMSFQPCAPVANDPETVWLAAGDYEVVLVQGVRHTAALLALMDLEAGGHSLAASDYGTWKPGSIDCDEAIRWDIEYDAGSVPVQCEPFGVTGVEIDVAAGTATLPYTVRQGAEDLDITLVSEPVPWRLEEDVTAKMLGYESPTAEPLACGSSLYGWYEPGLNASTPVTDLEGLLGDEGAPLAIDTHWVSSVQAGTLTIDSPSIAWISEQTVLGNTVAAYATATLTPRRNLTVDRATDYVRTTLHLSDYTRCPEVPGGGDGELVVYDRSVIVMVDSEVWGEDGTRDEAESIEITLGDDR